MDVMTNPVTTVIKRTLAECGELTLAQIAKETGLTPVNVASILEHNSTHFYSRKEGGVVQWSLAY